MKMKKMGMCSFVCVPSSPPSSISLFSRHLIFNFSSPAFLSLQFHSQSLSLYFSNLDLAFPSLITQFRILSTF
ncbi:hypothetical protein ACS0TY_023827 [Phlomoides rotata]